MTSLGIKNALCVLCVKFSCLAKDLFPKMRNHTVQTVSANFVPRSVLLARNLSQVSLIFQRGPDRSESSVSSQRRLSLQKKITKNTPIIMKDRRCLLSERFPLCHMSCILLGHTDHTCSLTEEESSYVPKGVPPLFNSSLRIF